MDKPDNTYKLIKIQQLEQRPQIELTEVPTTRILQRFTKFWKWSIDSVLYYKDTGFGDQRIELGGQDLCPSNAFVLSFLHAYNQHGDVLLVPDDIWLTIIKFVSCYIDQRAQKLRHLLVKHNGKKTLTVKQQLQPEQDSKEQQKQWDSFFDCILTKIRQQTVEGVVQNFQCDFSTTTKTYKVISTTMIMNSMQKFFQYKRRFCICGINNVYMAGQRADWTRMQEKLERLQQYDCDGVLKTYIEHMRVILANFVKTWDEQPDLQFWNTIMKRPETSEAYGGEAVQVEGWILHFFGIYDKADINRLRDPKIMVPIILQNQLTNTTKQLALQSSWVSVSKLNNRTYKPDIALWIAQTKQYPLNDKQ